MTNYSATKRFCDFLEFEPINLGNTHEEQTVRSSLAAYGEFSSKDTNAVYQAYADLIMLSIKAVEEVKKITNVQQKLHLVPITRAAERISVLSLDSSLKELRQQIGEANLLHLQHLPYLVDLIPKEILEPEQLVTSEKRKEMIDLLNELFDEIFESDFPPKLKAILLDDLEGVRRAIIAYKIHGGQGVDKAVEKAFGTLFHHYDEIRKQAQGNKLSELVSRLTRTLSIVGDAFTVGGVLYQLAGGTDGVKGLFGM